MKTVLLPAVVLGLFAAASIAAAQGVQRDQNAAKPPARAAHRESSEAPLRQNVRSTKRYNAGAYQLPPGYSRRQWNYSEHLPAAYYARSYWITNYLVYSLFFPPPGLLWVRVADDALLLDRNTGEIIQVRYGVFY